MGRLRLFLALLIVDWVLGTPGVGIETRSGGSNDAIMGWVYSVAFLALIIALGLTWFARRYAGPLAMAVGAIAVVLAVADVFGFPGGVPAPTAMIVVDVFGIVIGAAIVWAASRVSRSATLPA